MKIYLAGPMRGIAEFNFPAFHAWAAKLRADGHEVFSPAERDIRVHGEAFSKASATGDNAEAEKNHGFNLREALADDLDWICRHADGIALMPGWGASKGANAERASSCRRTRPGACRCRPNAWGARAGPIGARSTHERVNPMPNLICNRCGQDTWRVGAAEANGWRLLECAGCGEPHVPAMQRIKPGGATFMDRELLADHALAPIAREMMAKAIVERVSPELRAELRRALEEADKPPTSAAA